MRETRRSLKAANIQMAAQLAVADQETRASLNRHVKMLKDRNVDLLKTITSMSSEINKLTLKVQELTPPVT